MHMKQINTETGVFFKFGDFRADGKRFKGYSNRISKTTGFFYEEWISSEAFILAKARNYESARKFAINNPERVKEIQAKHDKNNRGTRNAKNAKYTIEKLRRTPKWLTVEDYEHIKQIYKNAAQKTKETGVPWHVDHIIPLRGKYVSGLHVPTNLQILSGVENSRKRNQYVFK